MGHKVSPIGMRVGVIRDWESRWYADDKEYGNLLQEDIKIREYLFKELSEIKTTSAVKSDDTAKTDNRNTRNNRGITAGVSRIEIERTSSTLTVYIKTANSGNVVGKDSENILRLKKGVEKLTKCENVKLEVVQLANPELDATLVAKNIAEKIEERASFRTAQKRAINSTMQADAKGVKTLLSGRLGGADIARSEGYNEGVVPLHTLRSDIDYAAAEAKTAYGRLGVKVWICRGEVKPGEMVTEPAASQKVQRGSYNNNRRNNFRGRDNNNKTITSTPEAIAQTAKGEAEEAKKDGE